MIYMERPKLKGIKRASRGINYNAAFVRAYENKAFSLGCDVKVSNSAGKLYRHYCLANAGFYNYTTFRRHIKALRNNRDAEVPADTRLKLYQFFNYTPEKA